MRGLVYLLDGYGDPISVKKYANAYERRMLILDWRRMYAASFSKCMIQIAPIESNRKERRIDYMGEKYTITGIAKKIGISKAAVSLRLKRHGVCEKLFEPRFVYKGTIEFRGEMVSLLAIERMTGVSWQTIHYRVHTMGMTFEEAVTIPLKRIKKYITQTA